MCSANICTSYKKRRPPKKIDLAHSQYIMLLKQPVTLTIRKVEVPKDFNKSSLYTKFVL